MTLRRRALRRAVWAAAAALALWGCPGPPPPAPLLSDIQDKVFTPSCTFSSCHSSAGHAGDLVLEKGSSFRHLVGKACAQDLAAAEHLRRVVAGDPAGSFLVIKLRGAAGRRYGRPMPDGSDRLDEGTLQSIEEWIRRGAKDD